MEAWRDEVAVQIAVVGTDASHQNQLVVEVVGVLGINAWHSLFLVGACLCRLLVVGEPILLSQIVVVQTQACGEVVLLVEVVLEHERGIYVLFVHIVGLVSVERIFLVHRACCHQGNVGAMLLIEDECVLHVSLVAVGLHVDAVEFLAFHLLFHLVAHFGKCLAATAMLADERDSGTEHVVFRLVNPTVLQVVLQDVGHVLETVHVHVVGTPSVLVMGEHLGGELVVEVDIARGVGFQLAVGVAIEVGFHTGHIVCFQVFHVDLSRDALITCLDG